MTDDLKQKTAARLTHRHLLGIEGLSVLEMRSLLYRSVYFADVITGQRHDPGLEALLKAVQWSIFSLKIQHALGYLLKLPQSG